MRWWGVSSECRSSSWSCHELRSQKDTDEICCYLITRKLKKVQFWEIYCLTFYYKVFRLHLCCQLLQIDIQSLLLSILYSSTKIDWLSASDLLTSLSELVAVKSLWKYWALASNLNEHFVCFQWNDAFGYGSHRGAMEQGHVMGQVDGDPLASSDEHQTLQPGKKMGIFSGHSFSLW